MRYRVTDTVRPRRVAGHLQRMLATAGVDRTGAQCRDIVGRMYGYVGFEAMEADIGAGPTSPDDRRAGPSVAAARLAVQVAALVREGLLDIEARRIAVGLAATGHDGPRPLARNPIPERMRTVSAVRSALAATAANVAAKATGLAFVDGAGEDGAWYGVSGAMPNGIGDKAFCLVVHADGDWLMVSAAKGMTPDVLTSVPRDDRGRRDDLSTVLAMMGFLDAPASGTRPAAEGVEERVRRLLARIDPDVLSLFRTLPGYSSDLYATMRGEPAGPGTAREMIRRVPLLAGFAHEFCSLRAYGFLGPDETTFGRMAGGAAAFLPGHGMFRAPDVSAVERVLDALEAFDPRLGNRMSLSAIRHLAALPADAVPATATQAEAMFDCVDALLRFEEDGMEVPLIYDGLISNDWSGFADGVCDRAGTGQGLPRLFALLDVARVSADAVRRLAGALVELAAVETGRPPPALDRDKQGRIARRIAAKLMGGRTLTDHLASVRDFDGVPRPVREGGMIPDALSGLDPVAVLAALGCQRDGLAEVIDPPRPKGPEMAFASAKPVSGSDGPARNVMELSRA